MLTASITILSACGSGADPSLNWTYENKRDNVIYELNSGSGVLSVAGLVNVKFDYKVKDNKVMVTMEDGYKQEFSIKNGNLVGSGTTYKKVK